jgi:1-deoxyxylulose-5-phosphate synthase
MEALDDVVRAGKALYLGASSMPAYRLAKMQHVAERNGWTRFASMQNHYNIIYREEEREMMPYCIEEGIAVLPWSPLARGFVTGNRNKEDLGDTERSKVDDYAQKLYYRDEDFVVVDRISAVAKRLGVSNAQVALAWLLQQPGVTALIIGASKLHHLDELVNALGLKLGEGELQELKEVYRPHPVLGFT